MRFNITKTINGLAGTIFFYVCFCAGSLMERLGPVACLFVTLALLTLAYSLLKLTDRMGRRYILIERAVIPLPLGMGWLWAIRYKAQRGYCVCDALEIFRI